MAICLTPSRESFVGKIPRKAKVVFDRDNTLKVDCQATSLESFVDKIPREAKAVLKWDNTLKDVCQAASLESFVDQIPRESNVVFDWDNTLKVTSADRKHITCGLRTESLNTLAKEKRCRLYIISAIRPTRMNLDTLLLEVDRLGLRRYFCPECQCERFSSESCSHDIKPQLVKGQHTYAHWGNVIICNYDKAEVFLKMTETDRDMFNESVETDLGDLDESDSMTTQKAKRDVYFFDDEYVNIENFHHIVSNSKCVFVKSNA